MWKIAKELFADDVLVHWMAGARSDCAENPLSFAISSKYFAEFFCEYLATLFTKELCSLKYVCNTGNMHSKDLL